ncbi:unnamed protein product [Trichobilharzia regenti]|nr:unnamed protein product [Trichobilharzia regenti]
MLLPQRRQIGEDKENYKAQVSKSCDYNLWDYEQSIRLYPGDEFGRGAGKGGGGGGTIRDAGGAFGKREARNEEEYFYKLVSYDFISLSLINSDLCPHDVLVGWFQHRTLHSST